MDTRIRPRRERAGGRDIRLVADALGEGFEHGSLRPFEEVERVPEDIVLKRRIERATERATEREVAVQRARR
jgi:hypothetical protein